MMKKLGFAWAGAMLFAMLAVAPASAALKVDVTQGTITPLPIATYSRMVASMSRTCRLARCPPNLRMATGGYSR